MYMSLTGKNTRKECSRIVDKIAVVLKDEGICRLCVKDNILEFYLELRQYGKKKTISCEIVVQAHGQKVHIYQNVCRMQEIKVHHAVKWYIRDRNCEPEFIRCKMNYEISGGMCRLHREVSTRRACTGEMISVIGEMSGYFQRDEEDLHALGRGKIPEEVRERIRAECDALRVECSL